MTRKCKLCTVCDKKSTFGVLSFVSATSPLSLFCQCLCSFRSEISLKINLTRFMFRLRCGNHNESSFSNTLWEFKHQFLPCSYVFYFYFFGLFKNMHITLYFTTDDLGKHNWWLAADLLTHQTSQKRLFPWFYKSRIILLSELFLLNWQTQS